MNETSPPARPAANRRQIILRVGVLVVLALLVAGVYASPLREHLNIKDVRAALERVESLWYGPIVYILLYAVGVVLFMPASLFILAAGLIWGWLAGGTYALIGGVLGAFASYRLGRYVGGGILQRFGTVGARVAQRLDHAGFSTLLTLRLIPVFPFSVLNYGAGVAGIRGWDFLFATLVGLAPSNFVVTYSADALFSGELTREDALQRFLIVGALVALVVIIPAVLKRFVFRAEVQS